MQSSCGFLRESHMEQSMHHMLPTRNQCIQKRAEDKPMSASEVNVACYFLKKRLLDVIL